MPIAICDGEAAIAAVAKKSNDQLYVTLTAAAISGACGNPLPA
jgi:hypothetical protein